MIRDGTILGFRRYCFTAQDSGRLIEGFVFCVKRDPDYITEGHIGDDIDVFTISARSIGSYSPAVGDSVKYHLYKADGKMRCGFVMPI